MIRDSAVVIIFLLMTFSYPVHAGVFSGPENGPRVQTDEEPLDFEDWYPPDEAYQTDDKEKPTEGKVDPQGGENEPRVAPDEERPPREK